jgi:U3 small nucleolar RNA-associated protein 12
MVKSYLRYIPSATLGVIVSPNGNILSHSTLPKNAQAPTTLAIVPALEAIKIWNTKSSVLFATLHDPPSTAQVTALALNPARQNILAAGYHDGSIRLWTLKDDLSVGELAVTFNGHKSAVTHLAFDGQGNRLVSGSKDTDIVLWDIVAETGLVRLRAHTDQITGLAFLPESQEQGALRERDFLISAGKDGLVKVWDLTTSFCCETHVAHRGEVWALTVSPDRQTVVTAGPDGEVKFWSAMSRTENDAGAKVLVQRGIITRSGKDKPLTIKFQPAGGYLAVHGSSRNVEVFRIRSAEEIKKLLSRKRKRKAKKGDVGEDDEEVSEVSNEIVAYTTIRATSKVKSIDWESSPTTAGVAYPGQPH